LLHPSFAIIILSLFILLDSGSFCFGALIYLFFLRIRICSVSTDVIISFLSTTICLLSGPCPCSKISMPPPIHCQELYSEVPSLWHEARICLNCWTINTLLHRSFLSRTIWLLLVLYFLNCYWKHASHLVIPPYHQPCSIHPIVDIFISPILFDIGIVRVCVV
jgi:hypothetical protein